MLDGTTGAGGVLKLVRDGRATTRTELAQQSGLARSTMAERSFPFDPTLAPGVVLSEIHEGLGLLLADGGIAPSRARGIGVAVQAPVSSGRGAPVGARMMPGWDGFPIPAFFAGHSDVPVL